MSSSANCTSGTMDYEAFMSRSARRRGPNKLRSLITLISEGPEDLLCLTGALPHPDTFALTGLTVTLLDGSEVTLSKEEVVRAQQYWPTQGLKSYAERLNTLVKRLHDPPCWEKQGSGSRTMVHPTCGGTDAYSQLFQLLMDEGDSILIAEYSYSGAIAGLNALGLKPLPLALDEFGIVPESLIQTLSKWDPDTPPGTNGKPKLLYIVPNGQNPTGATCTLERKQAILEIACKYNFIVYEDDPYFLLTFTERTPSFLALDNDGRVIRSDSFAKTMGPGFRGGYMSGPETLMKKVSHQVAVTSYGTCALSQSIIIAMFNKIGIDGFLQQSERAAALYLKQRDTLLQYADKWMAGLVEYKVPTSGMFVWMKVKGVNQTKDLMLEKGLHAGILAIPGEYFSPINQDGPYIRVTYSTYSAETFDKAFQRLSELLKNHVKHDA